MTKANVGHSALDATAGIAESMAALPDDEARIAFLQAAVYHADGQLTIAEDQHDRLTTKAADVKAQWDAKVTEAGAIRDRARDDLEAFTREYDALVGN